MVTVEQPPLLPAALGQDVVLPCSLRFPPGDRQTELAVLYWIFTQQNPVLLWFPSKEYQSRVELLDHDPDRLNNSIRLRVVQWSDAGPYLCKLTVTTEAQGTFRTRGNKTTLAVHDLLVLVRSGPDESLLHCAVNVSQNADFELSILHQGAPLQLRPSQQPVVRSSRGAGTPVTLSQTAPLQGPGLYECRLLLQGQLVAQTAVHLYPAGVEPWTLYVAPLLLHGAMLLLLLLLPDGCCPEGGAAGGEARPRAPEPGEPG